jgi:hypothetical protein
MIEIENNYFTMVEEHFRAARGTGMFLLSPLDLALVEAWKNDGIPIEAVLRGIDITFEKWRRRPARGRTQMVNSIAYCAQAIAVEALAMAGATLTRGLARRRRSASRTSARSSPGTPRRSEGWLQRPSPFARGSRPGCPVHGS